jgi:hypothetical protein
VLIAAHGNSLRALIKYLDGISDSDIVGLNIPNGVPLVYDSTPNLKPIRITTWATRTRSRRRRPPSRSKGKALTPSRRAARAARGRPAGDANLCRPGAVEELNTAARAAVRRRSRLAPVLHLSHRCTE